MFRNNVNLYNKINGGIKPLLNSINKDKIHIVETNNNGCYKESDFKELLINNLPDLPIITQNNNNLTINNKVYKKYHWFRNNVLLDDTSNTILNAQSGEYFVSVFDENGCNINSDIFKMNNSKIFDLSNSKVNIYPNPASEFLFIQFKEFGTLNIYSIQGNLINSFELNENELFLVDLKQYNNGLYFIQIKSGQNKVYNQLFSVFK